MKSIVLLYFGNILGMNVQICNPHMSWVDYEDVCDVMVSCVLFLVNYVSDYQFLAEGLWKGRDAERL